MRGNPDYLANTSRVMRLAFAEDAMAIASWAEALGFDADAAAMREFAVKVRPAPSQRWADKRVSA